LLTEWKREDDDVQLYCSEDDLFVLRRGFAHNKLSLRVHNYTPLT